jgi:hypothetical protein
MGCSTGALLPRQHVPELLSSAALCYLSLSSLLPCTGGTKNAAPARTALETSAVSAGVRRRRRSCASPRLHPGSRCSPKPRSPRMLGLRQPNPPEPLPLGAPSRPVALSAAVRALRQLAPRATAGASLSHCFALHSLSPSLLSASTLSAVKG